MDSFFYLFALLSARQLASRPLRSLLAIAGLSLGVALAVGVGTLNQSASEGLERSVSSVLGRAAIEISGGPEGVWQSVARKVRRIHGVEAAASVIEHAVRVRGGGDSLLTVFATDMIDRGSRPLYSTMSRAGQEIIGDPLIFLSQPNSLILAEGFASKHGLGLGSRFEIMTPSGLKPVVVRGILRADETAGAFGGNLAVMDLAAAQELFGRRRRVDRVDISIKRGFSREDTISRLRSRFPNLMVHIARADAEVFRRASSSLASVIALAGLFTLAAGCFLVFNVATMEAEERRGEAGILHCLGAPRKTLLLLFSTQGAIVGTIAGVIGVATGVVGARLAASAFAAKVATIVSAPVMAAETGFCWPAAAAGMFSGVAGSTLGFLLAALAATGAAASEGARGLHCLAARRPAGGRGVIFGASAIAASIMLLALEYEFYLGFLEPISDAAILLGSALLLPYLLSAMGAITARSWWQRMPLSAFCAARNIACAAVRSSSAVGVLALTVAVVLVFATIQRSIGRSIGKWIEGAFAYDLEIASQSTAPARLVPLDEELAERLAAVSGVRAVHMVRWVTARYRDASITVHALDYSLSGRKIQRLLVRRGDSDAVYRDVASGSGVAVSENFASHFHLGPGDVISIDAPRGQARLKIAGVAVNYNSEEGTVMMSRSLLKRYWGDRLVNYFLVTLNDDATVAETRAEIARRFGQEYDLVILTLKEAKARVDAIINGIFRWIYALEALVAGIGLLTVMNTMSVSVMRRRPQMSVLRAVGAGRDQVAEMVLMEALLIGLLGLVVGGTIGTGLALAWVKVHCDRLLGWIVQYSFPWGVAGATCGLTLLVSLAAGLCPARKASRFAACDELRDPNLARV